MSCATEQYYHAEKSLYATAANIIKDYERNHGRCALGMEHNMPKFPPNKPTAKAVSKEQRNGLLLTNGKQTPVDIIIISKLRVVESDV